MLVTLSWAEVETVCNIGIKRKLHKISKGSAHRWNLNFGPEEWGYEVYGALGECVLSKALNVYWSGTPGEKELTGDVDGNEVRTTHHENGSLPMHETDIKDKPDKKFYLVTIVRENFPKFNVVGWIYGKDAKKEKYWGTRGKQNRPAFWVPQEDLNTNIIPAKSETLTMLEVTD